MNVMAFRKSFDLSVYFVADPSACDGRDVTDVVMQAVAGGVSTVQLRDKSGDERAFYAQAAMLAELLKPRGVPFLINDNVDIAFACQADGVHLGQGDAHPDIAREKLGPEKIIGVTAFKPEHFSAINPEIVDYAGTGPVYETLTDKGKPVLGPENFSKLAALSPVPVVGIGGITAENAPAVIQAGAHGVAMMRSISAASDPQQAASDIISAVKTARLKEVS